MNINKKNYLLIKQLIFFTYKKEIQVYFKKKLYDPIFIYEIIIYIYFIKIFIKNQFGRKKKLFN